MNLKEYTKKVENMRIDYDGVYGHQCVDLVKHYALNVLGVRLGSFGGSAKTGWYNRVNTFKPQLWKRIKNNYKNVNQVPLRGDILFIKTATIYDHVVVVLEAKKGENKIVVLEQNMGDGDGVGYDDRIKISTYTYKNVYGWYRLRTPVTEKTKEQKILESIDLKNAKIAYKLGLTNGQDVKKPITKEEALALIIGTIKEVAKGGVSIKDIEKVEAELG